MKLSKSFQTLKLGFHLVVRYKINHFLQCKPKSLANYLQTDGKSTVYGDNFQESAIFCYKLNPNQIIAVGVNCIAPHAVESLLRGINDIPLIVYANSGEKYDPDLG